MTAVLMPRYSSFNNVVILKSQAYELALDVREAQVFGVSTRGTSNSYREAFGISFDLTQTNNAYKLFQDASGDLKYDTDEEIGDVYTIDPRFEISEICTTRGTTRKCNVQKASVAFKRPDFDARIWALGGFNIDKLEVVISVAGDNTLSRTVSVYPSGQISVQ